MRNLCQGCEAVWEHTLGLILLCYSFSQLKWLDDWARQLLLLQQEENQCFWMWKQNSPGIYIKFYLHFSYFKKQEASNSSKRSSISVKMWLFSICTTAIWRCHFKDYTLHAHTWTECQLLVNLEYKHSKGGNNYEDILDIQKWHKKGLWKWQGLRLVFSLNGKKTWCQHNSLHGQKCCGCPSKDSTKSCSYTDKEHLENRYRNLNLHQSEHTWKATFWSSPLIRTQYLPFSK